MRRFILPAIAVILIILYYLPLFTTTHEAGSFLLSSDKKINALYVKKGDDSFRYEKKDGQWMMTSPYKWRADSSVIKRLLQKLHETKLENLITEDQEKFGDFNLKSPETVIEVRYDQGGAEKLLVGKRGPRYSLIYVSKDDNKGVYLVSANFMELLPNRRNDFRDRTIADLPEAKIEEIRWEEGKESFHLIHNKEGWLIVDGERKETPEPEDLKRYLGRFAPLAGNGFPEGNKLPEKAEKKGLLTIKAGDTIELPLYGKDNKWFLLKGGVPYEISGYLKGELFRKVKKKEEKPTSTETEKK
ncbi:MAG: DUF4340 domain-containing protein [Nitrospirae bacterium]|nr:MAG: DUF4340 domain-containing protein [Nitrospirota bacterium]